MAFKTNDATVIDSDKNILSGTLSLQGTIVKATTAALAPTGTTAQRPSSPSTGMIFFDTDEGKLVSYNGTEWV